MFHNFLASEDFSFQLVNLSVYLCVSEHKVNPHREKKSVKYFLID